MPSASNVLTGYFYKHVTTPWSMINDLRTEVIFKSDRLPLPLPAAGRCSRQVPKERPDPIASTHQMHKAMVSEQAMPSAGKRSELQSAV
jgi:hypothetical protein